MNKINEKNSLLLIIDVQDKLVKMLEESDVSKNAGILVKSAEILNIPTIITEQYPKGLGDTIKEVKEGAINAKYFEKTTFSACLTEGILEYIQKIGKKQIILSGIETHICILQTAFDLLNKSYEVYLVEDACGSRTKQNKESALKRLLQAGCQTVTTEMVIFEWLKSSKHPNFKEIQAYIK